MPTRDFRPVTESKLRWLAQKKKVALSISSNTFLQLPFSKYFSDCATCGAVRSAVVRQVQRMRPASLSSNPRMPSWLSNQRRKEFY